MRMYCKMMFLVVIITCSVKCTFRPEIAANVITFVLHKYRKTCIVFLRSEPNSGLEEQHFLYTVVQEINKVMLQVKVMYMEDVKKTKLETNCTTGFPLFVILTCNTNTRENLKSLSTNVTLSGSGWLVFYSFEATIEIFFQEINVPFNCQFLIIQNVSNTYILTEIYKLSHVSPIKTHYCGKWGSASKLDVSATNRLELEGATLNATTMRQFVLKHERKMKDKRIDASVGEVVSMLSNAVNFRTRWLLPWNFTFGVMVNGSWNGMVEMTRSGTVEVSFDTFSIDNLRRTVVDFTVPVIVSTVQMHIKEPEDNVMNWNKYFRPFSRNLWFSIMCAVVVIFIPMTCAIYFGRKMKNNIQRENSEDISSYTTFFVVLAIFLQQGGEVPRYTLAASTLLIVAYGLAVLILSAYSATVISSLSTEMLQLPFQDFRGLLKNGEYRFIILNIPLFLSYFRYSKDPLLQRLFETHLAQKKLPTSLHEALKQTCSTKIAFFTNENDERFLKAINCKLIKLHKDKIVSPISFIVPKNSWYKEVFNIRLVKMKENGIFARMNSLITTSSFESSTFFNSVDVDDILPILAIFVMGCIAAFVVLLAENFTTIHKTPRDTSYSRNRPFECIKYYNFRLFQQQKTNIRNRKRRETSLMKI